MAHDHFPAVPTVPSAPAAMSTPDGQHQVTGVLAVVPLQPRYSGEKGRPHQDGTGHDSPIRQRHIHSLTDAKKSAVHLENGHRTGRRQGVRNAVQAAGGVTKLGVSLNRLEVRHAFGAGI